MRVCAERGLLEMKEKAVRHASNTLQYQSSSRNNQTIQVTEKLAYTSTQQIHTIHATSYVPSD